MLNYSNNIFEKGREDESLNSHSPRVTSNLLASYSNERHGIKLAFMNSGEQGKVMKHTYNDNVSNNVSNNNNIQGEYNHKGDVPHNKFIEKNHYTKNGTNILSSLNKHNHLNTQEENNSLENNYSCETFCDEYDSEESEFELICEVHFTSKPNEEIMTREQFNKMWPQTLDMYILHIYDLISSYMDSPEKISLFIYHAFDMEKIKKKLPSKSSQLWKRINMSLDDFIEEIKNVHNYTMRIIYQSNYKRYGMLPPNFKKYFTLSEECLKNIAKNKIIMNMDYYKNYIYEENKKMFLKIIQDRSFK